MLLRCHLSWYKCDIIILLFVLLCFCNVMIRSALFIHTCRACLRRLHWQHDKIFSSLQFWVLCYFCMDVNASAGSSNNVWLCVLLCCGAAIAEWVSALDWLLLHCAAITALRVLNPGLCPHARHCTTLALSVDRDENFGPVGRNWLRLAIASLCGNYYITCSNPGLCP